MNKKSQKSKFLFLTVLVVNFFFVAQPVHAQTKGLTQTESSAASPLSVSEAANSQLDTEHLKKDIAAQEKNADEKYDKIMALLKSQKQTIHELQGKIDLKAEKGGMSFEVWTGILLACVSIMVTILSIMLAFFQYTGIKNAKAESLQEARRIANDITPKVAERKLLEHVKEGGFNEIIKDAIDKIAFSNINDPENYTEGADDERI